MNFGFSIVAFLSAFVLSTFVSAQTKTPNFSGTWTLDSMRSKQGDHERLESMTITVVQSAKDIKVDITAQTVPPDPAYMGGPMRRTTDRSSSNTYDLSGKETRGEVAGPAGPQAAMLNAKLDGGKMRLTQKVGDDPVFAVTETWTLSADGKTLTVERNSVGRPAVLVFNRKR